MNTLLHKQSIYNVRKLALMLMCFLLSFISYSQEGSWGNIYIGNSGASTFFGAHNFVTGGSGSQPGLIKTARTAPLGILYYGPDATYTGADDANHVDGYVAKTGTSAFTFPIGNGTKLRTAGISAPAAAGTFKAAYWFENPNSATLPAGAPFPVANLGTGVTGVSNVEYWDVDGPSAIDLTLTWDAASGLNALSGGVLSNLAIVGYNTTTSKWESLGGTATGTLTGTGSIVVTGVTPDNYSAFTFGSSDAIIVPDLTPTIDIDELSFAEGIARDFVVNLYEINGGVAAGLIRFRITKLSSFDITYPTISGTANVFGGTPIENGNWDFTENAGFITVTAKSGVVIAGNEYAVIGFNIQRKPSTLNGIVQNITATIVGGSGGETKTDNNIIITSVSTN